MENYGRTLKLRVKRCSRKSARLVLSCGAFVPACLVLAVDSSYLAIPYGVATLTAAAYHWSEEKAFVAADHGCAYSVIAANLWMMLHATSVAGAMGAASLILLGLACYARAHERDYSQFHSAWHCLSGAGGLVLALTYRHG